LRERSARLGGSENLNIQVPGEREVGAGEKGHDYRANGGISRPRVQKMASLQGQHLNARQRGRCKAGTANRKGARLFLIKKAARPNAQYT